MTDPYEIKDPWPTRIKEAANRWLVCWWRGHDRPQKFDGIGACERCGR